MCCLDVLIEHVCRIINGLDPRVAKHNYRHKPNRTREQHFGQVESRVRSVLWKSNDAVGEHETQIQQIAHECNHEDVIDQAEYPYRKQVVQNVEWIYFQEKKKGSHHECVPIEGKDGKAAAHIHNTYCYTRQAAPKEQPMPSVPFSRRSVSGESADTQPSRSGQAMRRKAVHISIRWTMQRNQMKNNGTVQHPNEIKPN